MKIRAVTNGNVIEVDDDAAKQLIDAGVYVPADEPNDRPKRPAGRPKTISPAE